MLNVFVGHGEEQAPVQPVPVDGEFGPKTEQAAKTFQGPMVRLSRLAAGSV
jgi:peptidoglycan hydrolase-like protein with peptidoglycan-binding domain